MNLHTKRSVSAVLSAVMFLGIASPPVQALDSSTTTAEEHADSRLCSHHETHTDECGGLTGSCTFVCLEHTPQTLPELDADADETPQDVPDETPDTPEDDSVPPENSEQPDVPTSPSETIPATPLTPAQPSEETQTDSPDTETIEATPTPRASDVVYTSATGGNQSHTGDGSYANPYNLFDDAVKNTMPGGTIIIKNKAFLNTLNETGSLPYIIDKDITIKSENPDNPAMLQVRAGGIVLGGDVTFEDVNLNFENRVHDAIFANGHTLTLKNVLRGNGSREIDLFGGQLYDGKSGQPYAADKKGSQSKIHIQMNDPKSAPYTSVHLGNIYAGSMNGSFDGNVEITIESENAKKFIGAVYASGAEEADPGNMLDIKEPAPPEANPAKYTVSGTVTMNFDSLPLRSSGSKPMLIDGNTGSTSGKTKLSVSVSNLTSNLELKNISELTVKKGTIQPKESSTSNFETIAIEQGAELDFSKIPSITTGTLSGAGALTLKRDGLMNVTTTFNDDTLTFQTEGAWNGASGIVNADHTYVTVPANSNGKFNFTPHQAQTGWTFEKENTEWKAKNPAGSVDLPVVTALSIDPANAQHTIYEKPPKSESPPYIPLQLQFESVDVTVSDIFYNSFTCSVKSSNSQTPIKFIHEDGDDDGYYYAEGKNFPFVLCIAEYDETALTIERASTPDNSGFQTIPLGNYEIEIGYPDKNGDMLTAKAYLTSVPNPPEPTNPQASNSQVTVKPSESSVAFGGTVNVTAEIQKATTLSSRAIEANNAYLYVNGNLVTQSGLTNPIVDVTNSSISFANIAITPDNGFHAGQNQISVVYGGGDKITALGALKGSTGTANITVSKADPTVSVTNNSPITQTYNGSSVTYTPQNLTVPVPNLTISNPQFSVIYKKDGTALDQPPNSLRRIYDRNSGGRGRYLPSQNDSRTPNHYRKGYSQHSTFPRLCAEWQCYFAGNSARR